ncbi:MAG: hypothetical protein JRE40_00035 [Deltaproteobacteria bacterium]|nr:hypothetical protein [Deltaproteobacteria bacterium]
MARTEITETPLVFDGVEETQVPGDQSNGMYFTNRGDSVLHFINNSGGAITVTIVSAKTVQGLAIADISVVVGAGTEEFIKPLPSSIFNNALGQVDIDLSGDTSFFLSNLKI